MNGSSHHTWRRSVATKDIEAHRNVSNPLSRIEANTPCGKRATQVVDNHCIGVAVPVKYLTVKHTLKIIHMI